MNKEFKISIQRPGEKGDATASQLLLPASWVELTDALDQARIWGERQLYTVTVLKTKREYLSELIPSYVNLYELNYLAGRLTSLTEGEHSAFEALVRMDEIRRENSPVPIERLINLTHSTGSCHHVSEITSDRELGEFVLENGLREDLVDLSEESIRLLDKEAIGREHREATGGVITSAGYFERSDGEISSEYHSTNLLMPEKPEYVFQLVIVNPDLPKETSSGGGMKLKLPTDPIMVETVLKTLHAPLWERCVCSRFDSIIPQLEEMPIDFNELEQINELAFCIKSIEESGQLPKYKALLSSIENTGSQTALQLIKEMDAFTFYPDMVSPADYADFILSEHHNIRPGDSWYQYIDLYGYGCSVMEKDYVSQTGYGFIKRTNGGPMISSKDNQEPSMELQL